MNYEKPAIIEVHIMSREAVSTLTQWLNQNQLNGAGITTYFVAS